MNLALSNDYFWNSSGSTMIHEYSNNNNNTNFILERERESHLSINPTLTFVSHKRNSTRVQDSSHQFSLPHHISPPCTRTLPPLVANVPPLLPALHHSSVGWLRPLATPPDRSTRGFMPLALAGRRVLVVFPLRGGQHLGLVSASGS